MAKTKASFHWDDPLLLEQQLSDDERAVREAARAYAQDRLLPRVLDAFRNGTTDVAKAYLDYLYTPAGQKIAVRHYYRPSKPEFVDAEALDQFPKLTLFSVKDVFGSWKAANDTHFKEGGVFDSIYLAK